MCSDDSTLQDWGTTGPRCKDQVSCLMEILGSPWAPGKSQGCATQGDFLGLCHDLSDVPHGIVRFWRRPMLVTKALDIIALSQDIGFPAGRAAMLH
eukprot:11027261-Karenia_brevis.AAC.1